MPTGKPLPDHDVRQIRQMYEEHQQARKSGLEPKLSLTEIAQLFKVHWTTIYLIGRRLSRAGVSDTPDREDEGRFPKQSTRRRRGKKKP